jgi:hypothetical protein
MIREIVHKILSIPNLKANSLFAMPIYSDALGLLKQEDVHDYLQRQNIDINRDYLSKLPKLKDNLPLNSVNPSHSSNKYNTISIVPLLIETGLIDKDFNDLCKNSKSYEIYQPDPEIENWQPVPPFLVSYNEGYYASDKGHLRLADEMISPTFISQNRYGKYKVLMLQGKPHYYHRIIWWTFNPHTPLNSRILYRVNEVDNDKFLDCSIDKLFVSVSSCWDNTTIDFNKNPVVLLHPIYGHYTINSWLPLRGHLTRDDQNLITEYTEHEIMFLDQTLPCVIRRKDGDLIKIFEGLRDPYVSLTQNKKTNGYLLTHVMLASAFPQAEVQKDVDHIDDDRFNHDVSNLQWLSSLENLRKNQLNTSKIPRDGTEVKVTDKFGYEKICRSASEASRIIYFMTQNQYQGTLKSVQGKVYELVSLNCSNIRKTVRGFRVERTQILENLPDEDWNPYIDDPMYLVSNKGRVIGKHNVLLRNSRCRNGPYSSVNIGGKYIYVHHVIWKTYHGKMPEKPLVILHNDLAPKDKQYYYRNWAEDLSSGTKSINSLQYNHALRLPVQINKNISKKLISKTGNNIIYFMDRRRPPTQHILTIMPSKPLPPRYPAIGQYFDPLFQQIVDSKEYASTVPIGPRLVDAAIAKLETFFQSDEKEYKNYSYKLQRLAQIALRPSKITVQISYPIMSFRKEKHRVLCNLYERCAIFELHEWELGSENYFSSIQTPVKRTLQSLMDTLPNYQSSVLLDDIYENVANIYPSINDEHGEIDFNSILNVSIISRENTSYEKNILTPVVSKEPEFDAFYNSVCRYLLKPHRMYIQLSAFNQTCTLQLFDTQCDLTKILSFENQTISYESLCSFLPDYHKTFIATMLPMLQNDTNVTISICDGFCYYEDVGSYFSI